ncbi:MAG: tetratricopeptide repeat protein [Planctomycetes bacterium]|nr:tetratricopeptide repeat protein [Planctomycetota bacterium]
MPDAEVAYLFRHALLRDAAYELQPPGERARLHGLVLSILEAVLDFPQDDSPSAHDAYAEEMAEHAQRGSRHAPALRDKERFYLARAATYARDHYHAAHVAELFERLAELEGTPPGVSASAYINAARQRQQEGRMEEAARLLKAAQHEAEKSNDPSHMGNVLLELSILARKLGETQKALDLARKAIEYCARGDDCRKQVAAWNALGNAAETLGDLVQAENALRKSLELARQLGELEPIAAVLTNLADVYGQTGRHAEADQTRSEALELAVRVGRREYELTLRGQWATRAAREGRFAEAEQQMAQCVTLARETGNRRYEALMLGNLAQVRSDAGRLEEAEATFRLALERCRETGNRTSEALQLANLGVLYTRLGRYAESLQVLEQARRMYAQQRNRYMEGWVRGLQAGQKLRAGRVDEAREDYRAARAALMEMGTPEEVTELEESWRVACADTGTEA